MPSTLRLRRSEGNGRTSELCPCSPGSLLQSAGELSSRAHSELRVDVGQVARHRPLAEEERRGDLPIRLSAGDEVRDAALGRCQTFYTCTPTDPSELGARPCRPAHGPQLRELGERRLDRLAGCALLPRAPPDEAQREQRPRAAERVPDRLVLRDCFLE